MRPLPAPPVVLAVDDDPSIRDSLAVVFEEQCELVLARDGIEAFKTLRSRHVDVVLLDLLMPRMHGHDVLQRIRRDHSHVPVIVLSALADIRAVVTAIKLGAWDYVTKPWSDEELMTRIYRAAGERLREAGALIVSDDAASLAPLQLALERRMRVFTTNIARALTSDVAAHLIVLSSTLPAVVNAARRLRDRYPDAALVIVDLKPHSELAQRLAAIPVTAIVESGRLDAVLTRLTRLGIAGDIAPPQGSVATALEFIAAHYGNHITVSDVADAACLSEDRLAHVFRDSTGFSVKDYITRLRVAIARRLLTETTETLDTIADRLGFAHASHLSRSFKQVDGVRPGEFRRSVREGLTTRGPRGARVDVRNGLEFAPGRTR